MQTQWYRQTYFCCSTRSLSSSACLLSSSSLLSLSSSSSLRLSSSCLCRSLSSSSCRWRSSSSFLGWSKNNEESYRWCKRFNSLKHFIHHQLINVQLVQQLLLKFCWLQIEQTEAESVFRRRGRGSILPFPLLLLSFNFMWRDVRSKEVTALVQQLDKLHHGLLPFHVTQGGPLFSAHRARLEVKIDNGGSWANWAQASIIVWPLFRFKICSIGDNYRFFRTWTIAINYFSKQKKKEKYIIRILILSFNREHKICAIGEPHYLTNT